MQKVNFIVPSILTSIFSLVISISAYAQELLPGDKVYNAENGSTYTGLQAWAGDHVVYYHDPNTTLVNLDAYDIADILGYFDSAMALYREYGGIEYPLAPEDFPANIENPGSLPSCSPMPYSNYPNMGSVILLPHSNVAGLGCNGAAEQYSVEHQPNITNPNQIQTSAEALFLYPEDVRPWHVAIYELGRLNRFGAAISPYFDPPKAQGRRFIHSTFPHFIKAATRVESGLADNAWTTDYFGENWWRGGPNPINMKQKLDDTVFNLGHDYLSFFSGNPGHSYSIVSFHWVIFHYLREEFGHEFMVEFFDFAREHGEEMKPSGADIAASGQEIAQNIIRAANVAYHRVNGADSYLQDPETFLRNEFKFPAYQDDLEIRLDSAVTKVAPGEKTVISWSQWGSNIPSNTKVLVHIDSGAGWQHIGRFPLEQNSIEFNVPQTNKFTVHIGLTNGAWLATDMYTYSVEDVSITLNDAPEGLSNVGHALISWDTDFEFADSHYQIFIDYPGDGTGWKFLGFADKKQRSERFPLAEGYDSAWVYIGIRNSTRWVGGTMRRFTIVDDH